MVSCYSGEEWKGRFKSALWTAIGDHPGDLFGADVFRIDDVTGDGVTDLLVSSPGFDPQDRIGLGAAYVLSGRDGARVRAHIAPENEWFGFALERLSDRDGDGTRDYAVFGMYRHPDERWIATKYVFSGKTGEPIDLYEIAAVAAGQDLPRGDANADGFVDVADVALTIASMGLNGSAISPDTTGDWFVDTADLRLVIENLGRRGRSPASILTPGADAEWWPREGRLRKRSCWMWEVHQETCRRCIDRIAGRPIED
jgi:hypothetical protein